MFILILFILYTGKSNYMLFLRATAVDTWRMYFTCTSPQKAFTPRYRMGQVALPSHNPFGLYFIQSYDTHLISSNLHKVNRGMPDLFLVVSSIHCFIQSWESGLVCLKWSYSYVTILSLIPPYDKLGQDAFINAESCNKYSHFVSSLHEPISNFLYIQIANNYIRISLCSL